MLMSVCLGGVGGIGEMNGVVFVSSFVVMCV